MLEKYRRSITDTQDPAERVIYVETVALACFSFSFFLPVDSEDIAILRDHLVALSIVACHTNHGRLGVVQTGMDPKILEITSRVKQESKYLFPTLLSLMLYVMIQTCSRVMFLAANIVLLSDTSPSS